MSKTNDNCGLTPIIIRDKCLGFTHEVKDIPSDYVITRNSHIIGCHLWATICGNYLVEKLLLNIIRTSHLCGTRILECMKGIVRHCELVLKRYTSTQRVRSRNKIYSHLDGHLISLTSRIEIIRISKLSAMLHQMMSHV